MAFRLDRYKMVLDAIRANPAAWCQEMWHGVHDEKLGMTVDTGAGDAKVREPQVGECGTVHCVAGWAQMLAGHEQDSKTAQWDGGDFLGLGFESRHMNLWIFRAHRTMEDLEAVERGEREPIQGNWLNREAQEKAESEWMKTRRIDVGGL